jgi:hypothetical protein
MIRQALALSVYLMAVTPVFADQECACNKNCMTQCQKGNSEECKCKMCDCAKTGKCDKDSCKHEEKK